MPQSVAIVTGASRGIGRAIALELAGLGHAVVVNFAHNPSAAEEVVRRIVAAGGTAISCRANVAAAEDRQRLVASCIEKFGRLDVLVNNAGITSLGRRDVLEATEESWDEVFATNLKGPFFLTQLAANEMIRLAGGLQVGSEGAGGTIVNISSISGSAVSANRADYCLTKSALRTMTWLFADRLAEHGIGVFEICPGVIATDMTGPVKERYDRLIADGLSPIRRWGQPEDVAKAVGAVVSGAFPFSTGETIHVDGGFHIRRL